MSPLINKNVKTVSILFLYFFLFFCTGSYGQTEEAHSDISTISLAVVLPREIKGLTEAQAGILEDRIKNIVSMNGLSAEGGLEGFIIYPKFDIFSTENVVSGMKTIVVTKCNLSLFVRQYIPNATSNIVFSSYNKDIVGSGYSESEAIANAITQVRPGDDAFQEFLNKTRTRIISYYVQNCQHIVDEATNAANLENYNKAFALLLSIPKEATQCYGQVQQKTIEIYLKKQRQDCSRFILKARTFFAANNFDSALATLRNVDPESVCKEDLWSLVNEISTKVDAKEKQALELYEEQLRNNTELEKARIAAASEMAKAYIDGAGRRTYVVSGTGPNATILTDPPIAPEGSGGRPVSLPGKSEPDGSSSVDMLSTTSMQPNIFFDNNIFPSFILSRAGYTSTDELKQFGDIYSCIGMSINNPVSSGTLTYEIEPVEDKYFEKVSGSISFLQNKPRQFFPQIPWKFEALKGIQQSTPLSIKYRLIDNKGKIKEQVVKISIRSIRECITSFTFDSKTQMSPLLAAYVNEENPQIDKLLKEGLEKKWVSSWDAYQGGPEGLDKQVKAIWMILSSKGIHYSSLTGATTGTSQTFTSQIVRPFCESISNKQANCVDGTLVFASILKTIGIRPVLVLVPGHCFLAYHGTESGDNDYIFLETTMLGDIKGAPTDEAFEANYLAAVRTASQEFKNTKGQYYMIDVQIARSQKVMPINLSDEGCK